MLAGHKGNIEPHSLTRKENANVFSMQMYFPTEKIVFLRFVYPEIHLFELDARKREEEEKVVFIQEHLSANEFWQPSHHFLFISFRYEN